MFRVIGHRENYRLSKRVLFLKLNSCLSTLFLRYKSHYTSLGLESNASLQDIKAAYYKLSLKYHPDKNLGSAESVEKFREITEAYEILGNQLKKKAYDASLSNRYSGYSESEWRRDHYSPRSYQYKGRTNPRTGKSQYYNYDEHYKQHYEEYEKERQAEYESFKRQWEADFRRRYPYSRRPDWSDRQQQEFDKINWKTVEWKSMYSRNYMIFFFSLWITVAVVTFLDQQPPPSTKTNTPPKPIYYKIEKEDFENDVKPEEG